MHDGEVLTVSLLTPEGHGAVIVRSADAEIVGGPPSTVQLLADASDTLTSQRVTLTGGADGAAPHQLLIVLTQGIERFGYFRLMERLHKGEAPLEELLGSQERFDNHFLDSPAWRAARDPGATS